MCPSMVTMCAQETHKPLTYADTLPGTDTHTYTHSLCSAKASCTLISSSVEAASEPGLQPPCQVRDQGAFSLRGWQGCQMHQRHTHVHAGSRERVGAFPTCCRSP